MTAERNAFITADGRGQYLVIGEGADLDAVTASEAWLKTTDPVELRP